MDPVTAYLGLGSNLGRREDNLAQAIRQLGRARSYTANTEGQPDNATQCEAETLKVLRASSVYETAPWGLEDQPDFLNCVVEISTALSPAELLDRAKEVEQEMGRLPGPRFGPRVIDVDILLYGNIVVDQPDLQIPHPRLHLRAFALIPLDELDPRLTHPTLRVTVAELAAKVGGLEGVKVWGPPQAVTTGED